MTPVSLSASRVDDDDSSRGSQPAADNVSQKSDSSRDSETTSSAATVATTTTTSTKATYTTDVIRIKCREMLTAALSTPCNVTNDRLLLPFNAAVKDHRQRIPRFVIRRYLEKSIQKKLFCHLQSLQIKTIFQEKKTIINSISENLLSRFIYGRDVIGANCVEQRRLENGKNEMFLLLQLLLLQLNATQ